MFVVFLTLLAAFLSLQHVFRSLLAYNGPLSVVTPTLPTCYYIAAARELSLATCNGLITACDLFAAKLLWYFAVDLSRLAIALRSNYKLQCTIVGLQSTIVVLQRAEINLQRAESSLHSPESSLQRHIAGC